MSADEISLLQRHARKFLKRCDDRDKELLQAALEAERAGNTRDCWQAMASRSENSRFRERLTQDLELIERRTA